MKASIIIPYFNREAHLDQVLTSLRDQTCSLEDFEIIVIDDGSEVPIKQNSIPNLKIIRTENRGSASARNSGLKIAKGHVIIFLDSDILVQPDFVERHCKHHQEDENLVVIGSRLHLDAEGKIASPLDTRKKLLNRYKKNIDELKHPWFMTYTCNVSVLKENLCEVFFDEFFRHWGLEDSEWGYRLYRKGLKFRFCEEVGGKHLFHDRGMNRKKFEGWCHNLAYLKSKHSGLEILNHFKNVFDPDIGGDYFSAYDKFEDRECEIS